MSKFLNELNSKDLDEYWSYITNDDSLIMTGTYVLVWLDPKSTERIGIFDSLTEAHDYLIRKGPFDIWEWAIIKVVNKHATIIEDCLQAKGI